MQAELGRGAFVRLDDSQNVSKASFVIYTGRRDSAAARVIGQEVGLAPALEIASELERARKANWKFRT